MNDRELLPLKLKSRRSLCIEFLKSVPTTSYGGAEVELSPLHEDFNWPTQTLSNKAICIEGFRTEKSPADSV